MRIVAGSIFLLLAAQLFGQTQPDRGNLQISCAPGYDVYVDGKLAGACRAKGEGCLVSNLTSGAHAITVRKSGYLPGQFSVAIEPGVTSVLKVEKLKLRRRIKFRAQDEPVDMTVESPPMFSDDTGTPGDHNLELNFVVDGDIAHDRKVFELPLIDVNYGVGENLQLKYEVPWVVERRIETDDAGREVHVRAHGIADSILGLKYRFYDDDAKNLSLAVYPQVEFRTPGSKSEDDGGVGSSGTTWILPLLVTKELEHVALTGNLGLEKQTGESGNIFAAVGLGTRLTPRLALLGEVFGEDLNHSDSQRILLNVGIRNKLDDQQTIGASVGRDIDSGDGQKHLYLRVSYQRYFGKS